MINAVMKKMSEMIMIYFLGYITQDPISHNNLYHGERKDV